MLDSTEYLTSQKLEQQTRNLTAEAQSAQSFSFGNPLGALRLKFWFWLVQVRISRN
jgi:hypothetical protein